MTESLLRSIKSVSEINSEIRQLLDNEFRFVRIRGEISNIRQPFSGHTYFILKDEKSQLNAVLFKNQQRWLSQELKDGQQIICDGRISVYEPRGQYQLIVDTVDFDGTGQLHIIFEQLKSKLKAEGLFDTECKADIPADIDKIALITSPTGAAIHDFLSICRKRKSNALIQILPVRVQGQGANEEIGKALDTAHSLKPDVIVLCRGGGSIEDLWSFNEETVARAIYRSTIPVVTGIGHEIDFTIADFCADMRCATPTAVAEFLITDPGSLEERLSYLLSRLQRSQRLLLADYTSRLNRAAEILSTFDSAFSYHTFTVENLFSRLHGAMALDVEKRSLQFAELQSQLLQLSPENRIHLYQNQLDFFNDKFTSRTFQLLESKNKKLAQNAAILDTLSPLKTLSRGYSIVSKKEDITEKSAQVITSVNQVTEQEEIEIKLHKGELGCRVLSKKVD